MDKLDAQYASDNADEITAQSNSAQTQKEVNQ
jgi:hypothetical protein